MPEPPYQVILDETSKWTKEDWEKIWDYVTKKRQQDEDATGAKNCESD